MGQTDVTRKGIFACLVSLLDQDPSDTDPVPVTFEVQNAIFGIGHSATVNPEEIVILIPGTYTLTAQGQVGKNSGGTKVDLDIFFQIDRQDGNGFVNVENSAIDITIKDSEVTLVGVVSLTDVALAQWKYRVMQKSDGVASGLGLKAQAAITGPPAIPAIPSIIWTAFKNAESGAPV